MTNTEKLSVRRRWLLILLGLSFAIWTLADLEVAEAYAADGHGWMALLGAAAGLVWVAGLLFFTFSFARSKLDPASKAALEDELVEQNRKTSFSISYSVLILLTVTFFLLSRMTELNAKDTVTVLLTAGIVTPMFTFAWLEGKGA
ncbi:hypothetical protein [Henriciella mobilis]|nr:hypothetical protein [Henriciella mobilis]